jgi:hypothetical protein
VLVALWRTCSGALLQLEASLAAAKGSGSCMLGCTHAGRLFLILLLLPVYETPLSSRSLVCVEV